MDKHRPETADGTGKLSLDQLISSWDELEERLKEILTLMDTFPADSGLSIKMLSETEDGITESQIALLEQITQMECQSLSDAHQKLELWKRCKAPGQAGLSTLSIVDQIAYSAISYIEYRDVA